jgi:hypothetical protein
MALIDDIKTYAATLPADVSEKNGINTLDALIAERKAFLSKKKLQYIAKFRIDDEAKQVKFTEMLKESGSGLTSGGGGFDDGMSPGIGFKTESYNTLNKGGQREGSIEEQSSLFGKDYTYNFDYKAVRAKVEELAKAAGYEFKYQITPIGL